jgi:hypothetical protein
MFVLDLLLFVTIFQFFTIILIRQCCIYDVTVVSYVFYNVDIWCCVVVGYVECVTGYEVFIQVYAVTSVFVACRIKIINTCLKMRPC